ncbi:MAG: TIR protein [Candidatus Collierbacteria bacterium GW2011_GWB1_44_6]|uniref:TIR protein n=2 Tax=Candidatus Collieribacteriota TaxID=1752725 RepID=A0A0G1JJ88_9BACT|nr:MAG: TIR protein [Candidatus Collierbacteria bacterium GW2011_GWC2_43_12]KKT71636.1 MAG: TIR protein [Candidatus Collierbacteria bacterium GW2011_GWB1_44_6]
MTNSGLILRNATSALHGKKVVNLRVAFVVAEFDRDVSDQLIWLFRENGIKCWTERDILPGSNHFGAIRRAYKEADFILVFLSKASVARSGEYQKYINLAIDASDEMPEGGIKLIPICLEQCEVPFSLQKFYSVAATQPDALLRLVLAWAKEWQRRHGADDWPDVVYQSVWE